MGADATGFFQGQVKGLRVFRVGGRCCGKSAVRLHLGRDAVQIGKPLFFQQPGKKQAAHSMKGCIDDAQPGPILRQRNGGNVLDQSIQVGIVGFLFQGNDQRSIPFRQSTGQGDAGHFLADDGTFFIGELGPGVGI